MFVAVPNRSHPSLRWATPLLFALLWLAYLWASTRPGAIQRGLLLDWGALTGGPPLDAATWRGLWTDGRGLRLFSAATQGASGCPGGCKPSEGVTVTGNQMRNLVGGHGGPPDLFWAIEPSEISGLSTGNNTYCEASSGASRFWISGVFVRFDEWLRTVPGDASSAVTARNDSRCSW